MQTGPTEARILTARRFAIATAAVTWLLLVVGGMVNPTGSSLACPDWPTCYGSLMPEMKGGILYEHSHRLLATLVGVMTLVLAFLVARAFPADRGVKALGLAAVGMVVLQGVLGGITVIYKLPTLVSTAHLALSMIFFGFLIYLAFRLRTGGMERVADRRWIVIAGTAVYLQILLGGLVRHTEAGRACGVDWMTCAGALWPHWGPGQMQVIHRLWGYLLMVFVVIAHLSAMRQARTMGRPLARAVAMVLPMLLLLQIALGWMSVATSIAVVPVTAHTAVAALLWAGWVFVYLDLGPMGHALAFEAKNEAGSRAGAANGVTA